MSLVRLATDASDLHVRLIGVYRTDPHAGAHAASALDGLAGPDSPARVGRQIAATLGRSDTYVVTPTMGQVVADAGTTLDLPVDDIHTLPPSTAGWCHLAVPWRWGDGGEAMWVDAVSWDERYIVGWVDGDRLYRMHQAAGHELALQLRMPPSVPVWQVPTATGTWTPQLASHDPTVAAVTRTVAMWLLMRQQVVASTSMLGRQTRRRRARAGMPEDSSLSVLRLRRAAVRDDAGPDDELDDDGRQLPRWSHQWLVSGHWRRQWYASEGTHRPVYIAPYLKGPEHLPYVARDRVRVLDR